MHVFHPKVINTDHHSSIQYLHSRHDPNIGLINGGYPQPLVNLKPSASEYRISEDDFFKWRREQQRRAQEKRRHHQQQQQQHQKHNDDDDYEDNGTADDEDEQSSYDEELYKKHKHNKSNSASSNQRKESKHKNHNYPTDDDSSSNSDKVYTNYSNLRGKPGKKQRRPQFRPPTEDETAKKYRVYGVPNVDAESSNIENQFLSHDPTAIDPGYYSTLPKNFKNVPPIDQDDIYSGLLAKKYNREIADKSKLLADINYSRKEQTRNLIQRRKSQEE